MRGLGRACCLGLPNAIVADVSSSCLSSNILKNFELFNCAAMPLVRYEIRCEHSLANPELYRSAARDDPEGLLEGVAMAGLVGIVRQLGDLAEYVLLTLTTWG